MSYFIVISGIHNTPFVTRGKCIPILEAQSYIAALAEELAVLDGAPSFLWEDGTTGTSNEIVLDSAIFIDGEIVFNGGTDLGTLLTACKITGATVRVWQANNQRDAHLDVTHLQKGKHYDGKA